jgi:hypothetical protein
MDNIMSPYRENAYKGDLMEGKSVELQIVESLEEQEDKWLFFTGNKFICLAKDWKKEGSGVIVCCRGFLYKCPHRTEWITDAKIKIQLPFRLRRRLKKLFKRVFKKRAESHKLSKDILKLVESFK